MAISIAEFDVDKTPFIILANSSGTGKTQMAFNLMAREEVEVFYIACGGVRENVHKGFSLRSSTFYRCVEKDMPRHLSDGSTHDFMWIPHSMTFAFIWALLTGNSKFDRPRTREEVFTALEDWKKCGKWPVFFLDDFPRSIRGKNDSAHQFMRNVFCSVGIPVILSARNTSAASVVSTEPVWHGGFYAQWCTVWSTLPPFQYLPRRALESNLQEIVQHSRPSLSKLAVEYAHANPFSDGMDFVEYMDAVAESLVSEYNSMNHVTRLTFRMEQICLVYAANNGMRVPRGESEPDTLSYLINNNFARLHESEPFTLNCGHSPLPLLDCAEPTTWQFLTDIPGPQCDALLHLCLMGGKTAGPSKSSNTPISFRQAFETANFEGGALKFDFANADHENSPAAGTPRETLVAGAIVSASRQNGFAGIAFPEFLSFLMYELGIQTSPDIRVNVDADVLELVASLKVPFLAPLDVEWPDFLTRTTLNLGLLFGKRDADRSSSSFVQDQITAECNICRSQLTRDFILGIFKRIPTTSRVHLVILNSFQSLYFFHEDALRDGREYRFQNTLFYRVRSVRRASCPDSCVKLQVCRYIQDKARVVKKTTCQRIVIFVELPEIEAPRA